MARIDVNVASTMKFYPSFYRQIKSDFDIEFLQQVQFNKFAGLKEDCTGSLVVVQRDVYKNFNNDVINVCN